MAWEVNLVGYHEMVNEPYRIIVKIAIVSEVVVV